MWLKEATATTVKMGPFLDETDQKTTEEALTISQADIRLSKNGGAFAQTNNSAGATHDENGWYGVPLDTTDTNTMGTLIVAIHESGALPVHREFMVVDANAWDSFCATAALHANVIEIDDDSTAADNLELLLENSLGADNKILISTDAQDLSTTLDVNTKTLTSTLALSTQMKTDVNAEVVDAVGTDTISELGQAAPTATPTIKTALMLLYMIARNKLTSTSSELGIYNDAGTKIAKKALSDDGTTFTEGEMASGA